MLPKSWIIILCLSLTLIWNFCCDDGKSIGPDGNAKSFLDPSFGGTGVVPLKLAKNLKKGVKSFF